MGQRKLTNDEGKVVRSPPRQNRALRAREFNALSAEERLAVIHVARGRDKYDLLLDAEDRQQMVTLLPPQDLFLLVKELGREDAMELLSMATSEQIAVSIDLDSWQGDRFDGDRSLEWLLASLDWDGEDPLQRLLEFDFDLLVLILQRSVTLLRGPEQLVGDDWKPNSAVMPYEFVFSDEERAKPLAALLRDLFEQHTTFFFRLAEALRSELPTVLEEEVYQQRRLRLLEYGFPDFSEALQVYARMDSDVFDAARYARTPSLNEPHPVAPGFALAEVPSCPLLAAVLAAGVDAETVWDLSYLLNRVMVADGVDIGDTLAAQETLERVYGYLNIALEHLCGSSLEKARELFAGTYLQALFQLGHNLVARLRREANRLLESPIGPFLEGPYAALIGSLGGRFPKYCRSFESTRWAGESPFAELRQLRHTESRLAEIEAQRRLFEAHFGFPLSEFAPSEDGGGSQHDEPLTLSDLFLTSLANRILGRDFTPHPLTLSELPQLHARVSENERVSEVLRRETRAWLESLEEGAGHFGDFCLDIWDEEFCGLDPAALDPRYIGGLLVR